MNQGPTDGQAARRAAHGAEAGLPTADEIYERLDRTRRLTGGLMGLATFACVMCVIAALLGWYESLTAAATPILLFGAIACAAAWRLRSLG